MNTKGIKFLAVLAVLAMAFAVFAVFEQNDAGAESSVTFAVDDTEVFGVKNSTLGNYVDIEDNVISGFVNKVSATNQGDVATAFENTWTGHATADYGYGLVYSVILENLEGKYVSFISVTGEVKSFEIPSNDDRLDTLAYINKDRASTTQTFAISDAKITTVAAFNEIADANKYTVTYDLTLSDAAIITGAQFLEGKAGVVQKTGTSSPYSYKLLKDVILTSYIGLSANTVYNVDMAGKSMVRVDKTGFYLNGNDITLNVTGSSGSKLIGFSQAAYIGGTGATVSFKNVDVLGVTWGIHNGEYTGATIVLDTVNMKVACSASDDCVGILSYCGTGVLDTTSSITIKNSKIESEAKGLWCGNGGTGTVTISDSEFTGITPLYLGCVGTATLTNVKSTAIADGDSALEIKSGEVTVSGGVFTANEYEEVTSNSVANNNGTGAGISAILINNNYETCGKAVKVILKNVKAVNNAQDSKEIIVANAGGPTDIEFTDNGEHSVLFAKYKDVAAGKKILLNTSTFSDLTVQAGANVKVNTEPAATVKATGMIIIAGDLDGKIVNENDKETEVIDHTGEKSIDEVISDNESAKKDTVVKVNGDLATEIDSGKVINVEQTNVAFVAASSTQELTNVNIVVTSTTGESKAISFTGFKEVSGTITTSDGTNKQTMVLNKLVGSFTISKGSIYIDGKIQGGIIELGAGADVKMTGSVDTAAVTIKMLEADKDKKATVTIEEDAVITFAGFGLIIEKNITLNVLGKIVETDASTMTVKADAILNVDGTVDITDLDVNGTMNVNDKGVVELTTLDSDKGKIIANSGSCVSGSYTGTDEEKTSFVAYSGSDINDLHPTNAVSWSKVIGKDASGGFWKYDSAAKTLSLNNYEGTYNFKDFASAIEAFDLTGTNKVTYAAVKEFEATKLFGNDSVKSITSASKASLEIEVDMSKVQVANLANELVVISGKAETTPLTMDQAAVSIIVKGSNSDWKAADVKTMNVFGVTTFNLDMNNSALGVSIMSGTTLDEEKVFGVTKDSENRAVIKLVSSALYVIAPTAINATSFTAMNESDVDVFGNVFATTKMDVTNTTTVDIDGALEVKDLIVKTDSVMNVKDMVLESTNENTSYNAAVMNITGDAIVKAGSFFTNNENGLLNNSGFIKVLGTFTDKGVVYNSGTISVPALVGAAAADQSITIVNKADDLGTGAAMIKTITFTTSAAQYDGTSKVVGAVVEFDQKSGADLSDTFDGKLVPAQDGTGVALMLENDSALLLITYDLNGEKEKIGSKWTVTVSGTVGTGEGKKTIVANISSTTKVGGIEVGTVEPSADLFTNVTNESAAALVVAANGVMNNTGDAIISHAGAGFLVKDAEWNGPVTANCALTVTGKLTGDITSNIGAVIIAETSGEVNGNITATDTVDVNGKLTGNIVTEKAVTISDKGTMKGDISTKATVTVGKKLEGNVTISGKAGDTSVFTTGENTAEFKGTLTYDYEYKATKGSDVKTTGTNKMDINGKAKFAVTLTAPVDSNTTTDGTPGYFTLALAPTVGATASIEYKLTEGKLMANDMIMPERAYVIVEKGTEFEIAKSNSFDVKKAALKISKEATAKISFESDLSPTYGVVKFIMGFETADGYDIYSDVAYALTNCDENANLVVGANADISSNVTVKKGVNVIVNDKVTLNFKGWGLDMGEGAKITLMGTGKVIFEETSQNLYPGDDTKDYDYYTISGTIDYVGNVVTFDGVRFTAESTIVGVAPTSTAVSKISTTLLFDEGTAYIYSGTGTGSITLGHDAYFLTKADAETKDDDKKTLVFATFTVGSEAVFDAVSIVDEFQVVDYKENDDEKIVIDKIKLMPTIVGVEGTLNLSASTEVKGLYVGLGTITLAAGKEIKLMDSAAKVKGTDKTAPGHIAAKIVDTTDEANGYVLNIVSASPEKTLTLKATTCKIEGVTFNVMTLKGDVGSGIITATNAVFLDGVDIQEDASVIGDAVYIIGDSDSIGYLAAKEIYMKGDSTTSSYKTLKYEVTFDDDDYTVYTYFASIDFDEITDITIAKDLSIGGMTDGDKLDLSGKDVNIVITEGKKLTIDKPLIIGTPINELAGEGSSISGKVVIMASNFDDATYDPAYRYLVAYSDVDLSLAEIYQADKKTAAVYSMLVIDDVIYATIFANEGTYDSTKLDPLKYGAGVGLAYTDKSLIPEIEGYVFTKWSNLNDDPNAAVGETTAYANAKAISVTVIVKFAEGVSYYLDGVEFAIYDTPTKVDYNSVFTAKINNTAKYEGTPLINGKNSFIVTEDATLTVTGVNPIPVPPEPEPEPVVGDSGLSLTDILLIVLVILIAIMVVILVLRLNRS